MLAIGAAVVGPSCAPTPAEPPQAALARLIGLRPDEVAWLDALSDAEQRVLHDALTVSGPRAPKAIDLLMKVLGPRDRLFAYVGYTPLPDRLRACDGLIRE